MEKKTDTSLLIKYFVAFAVANGLGNFFLRTLEGSVSNIWIARFVGLAVTLFVMGMFYHFWLKKAEKK